MAREGRKAKQKPLQLELQLEGAIGRTTLPTESRLHLRRVYLGVRHGCYSALFCTRSSRYGRVSVGKYSA